MSWSLNIGTVAGTVVRIHLTFLLFLAWIFVASYSASGAAVALRAVSRGVPVSHGMMTQFATLMPDAHVDEAV
jgi:stage IV sporulation protein FB